MSSVVELDMDETVVRLAKDSIQVKMKDLPSSELMRVSDVLDILLDLQTDVVNIFESEHAKVAN